MSIFEKLSWKILFKIVDQVILLFPHKGARFFDWLMMSFAQSPWGGGRLIRKDIQKLHKVKKFERFCVLADVNIGDSIIAQVLVQGIRELFPKAHIDYVVSRTAASLMSHGRDASRVVPLYTSAPFPSDSDIEEINQLVAQESYDIIFNFCPFLSTSRLHTPVDTQVIGYLASGAYLMRAQANEQVTGNILANLDNYIKNLLAGFSSESVVYHEKNGYVTVTQDAYDQARNFMDQYANNLYPKKVFFNPDTSSIFSRMPFELQQKLLHKILELPCQVFLGAGHAEKGIEEKLFKTIPDSLKSKCVIVPPAVRLDTYAALIDFCDIYITGDTGPAHIAAAEKRIATGETLFVNKTAFFVIFGATPGRVYGYDSEKPGFSPAHQQAPSHTYISPCTQRTFLYTNKNFILAKDPNIFFESIDINEVVQDIKKCL